MAHSVAEHFFRSLPAEKLSRLAQTFSDLAFAEGLAVTDGATGERRAIPACLTPAVVAGDELLRRVRLAFVLTSAVAKVARSMLSGREGEVLVAGLAPFERVAVEATWRSVETVATTRYDAYVAGGVARPLELNATIPAMQGYSDIAAASLVRAVGAERGMARNKLAGLIARNGSNTAALLSALLCCYRTAGGSASSPSIALACRENDAQLTELEYLSRTFKTMGYPAKVVLANKLRFAGEHGWEVDGEKFDMVYRHIFARRLDSSWPIAQALVSSGRRPIFNAVLAQLEEKAAFAELSRSGADPALAVRFGLSEEESGVARANVPWTRRCIDGPDQGPSGEAVDDLRRFVRDSPGRFVLKPSWDYGGKAVFVGATLSEPSIRERVLATFGRELSWPELVDAAFGYGGGGYVVQEFVEITREPHLLCTGEGPVWREVYVDFSAYGSLGIEPPAWGGVCRFSEGSIVNILGGGGVAPLLREEVAAELFG